MILRVGKGKAGPLIPFYACRLLRITGKPYLIRLGKGCRQPAQNLVLHLQNAVVGARLRRHPRACVI